MQGDMTYPTGRERHQSGAILWGPRPSLLAAPWPLRVLVHQVTVAGLNASTVTLQLMHLKMATTAACLSVPFCPASQAPSS